MSHDRVTLAPMGRIHFTESTALQRSSPDNAKPPVEISPQTQDEGDYSVQRKDEEYVIDCIVDYEFNPKVQLYRVRWYGYVQSRDT